MIHRFRRPGADPAGRTLVFQSAAWRKKKNSGRAIDCGGRQTPLRVPWLLAGRSETGQLLGDVAIAPADSHPAATEFIDLDDQPGPT